MLVALLLVAWRPDQATDFVEGSTSAGLADLRKKTRRHSSSEGQLSEEIKRLTNKLSEFQQSISNILNAQHAAAMNAIGNIR